MIQLVNAQEMARNYPETFKVPNSNDLDKMKVGDSAKICINNKERLWVLITEINGAQLKGKLDNNPVILEDVAFGDLISFKKENIYSILNQ